MPPMLTLAGVPSRLSILHRAAATSATMAQGDLNFFQKLPTKWQDVIVQQDGSVDTKSFLEAAHGLVSIFDLLGSVAFSPVKADMNKNIGIMEARYKTNPERFDTLQKLLLTEKEDKVTASDNANTSLLWFKRGLEFVSASFERSLANPHEELSVSFTEAYGRTLKKHHNMFIQPVFHLAMKATPYRKDFYAKLGNDQEQLMKDMVAYFGALVHVVAALVKWFKEQGLEK